MFMPRERTVGALLSEIREDFIMGGPETKVPKSNTDGVGGVWIIVLWTSHQDQPAHIVRVTSGREFTYARYTGAELVTALEELDPSALLSDVLPVLVKIKELGADQIPSTLMLNVNWFLQNMEL